MENETLFTEEAEPPGNLAGLVNINQPTPIGAKKNIKTSFTLLVNRGKPFFDFACSPQTLNFRSSFYPHIPDRDWNDWRWQLRHTIRDSAALARFLCLTQREKRALASSITNPLAITPYYASLLSESDDSHPLRRSVVPVIDEWIRSPQEEIDPLKEEEDSPVPGIIHRYPDRVLFLATGTCATYCRYCTRFRIIGQREGYSTAQWQGAIDYIARNSSIRDVLISGGDPLTLADEKLDRLLSCLRAIPHVEIIRIGTKIPAVLPQRITANLTRVLKRYHPLWLSIHVTHPLELTTEMKQACDRLADAGVPLGSQTVILAGINDQPEIMKTLFQKLLCLRVKPYYLYQCDPIPGSAHFRTPVSKGLEIIRALRGHTTGYAVPTFVIDAPGGGGKIPLSPEYVLGQDGSDLLLHNYEGKLYRYPDYSAKPHESQAEDHP